MQRNFRRHYSPWLMVYGYVWCDQVIDETEWIGHSCQHGPAPHRIKVCVIKTATDPDPWSRLEALCRSSPTTHEQRRLSAAETGEASNAVRIPARRAPAARTRHRGRARRRRHERRCVRMSGNAVVWTVTWVDLDKHGEEKWRDLALFRDRDNAVRHADAVCRDHSLPLYSDDPAHHYWRQLRNDNLSFVEVDLCEVQDAPFSRLAANGGASA